MDKTYVYWSGKAKYVRYDTPDLTYNKWNFVLYPREEHLMEIRKLQGEGVKNVLSYDDAEQSWKINIGRPVQRVWKGKVIPFAPPTVVDVEGRPITGVAIGNGSDVTAKIEVYSHTVPGPGNKKAKALRWESLRIDNLVPYEPKTDYPEPQASMVSGLSDQPKQVQPKW